MDGGREGGVEDHGKSPVLNVWVHVEDAVIVWGDVRVCRCVRKEGESEPVCREVIIKKLAGKPLHIRNVVLNMSEI